MPTITISPTVGVKDFAKHFAEFLPKELEIFTDSLGQPIIKKKYFLDLGEVVARFWSGREIDLYDPRWEKIILKAAEEYEKKYDKTITIELQYNPAS